MSFPSIPDPCHVGWENMSPAEKGRYCSQCKKVVQDLTTTSYEEIMGRTRSSNGEMCGRIDFGNLRQSYVSYQLSRSAVRFTRNFFIALMISFGASLFSVKDASARGLLDQMRAIAFIKQDTATYITVKGVVRDKENKELIPFANVLLMEGDSVVASAITDINGEFSISVPKGKNEQLSLQTFFIGYNKLILKNFSPPRNEKKVLMELSQDEVCVMEGIIVWEVPLLQDGLDGTKKTFEREQIKRMPR